MGANRQPSDDEPIRRLRHAYVERMLVEQRRDRIETKVLAVFLWFFISFWSLGIFGMAFGDSHVTFRNVRGILEVFGAGVFGFAVTFVGWPVLKRMFPSEEPGLLQWWDERPKMLDSAACREPCDQEAEPDHE